MLKRIFFILLLIITTLLVVKSQTIPEQSAKGEKLYTYYICFKGISSKQDVIAIEQKVRKNKVVNYFLGERFPVRYFTLKTIVPITKQQLISWIDKSPYTILFFGVGEESLEEAIMTGKNNN